MESLRIQILTDGTSGTRTRTTHILTFKFVEICSMPLTTEPWQQIVGFVTLFLIWKFAWISTLNLTSILTLILTSILTFILTSILT